jgi:hypothetical protein
LLSGLQEARLAESRFFVTVLHGRAVLRTSRTDLGDP